MAARSTGFPRRMPRRLRLRAGRDCTAPALHRVAALELCIESRAAPLRGTAAALPRALSLGAFRRRAAKAAGLPKSGWLIGHAADAAGRARVSRCDMSSDSGVLCGCSRGIDNAGARRRCWSRRLRAGRGSRLGRLARPWGAFPVRDAGASSLKVTSRNVLQGRNEPS